MRQQTPGSPHDMDRAVRAFEAFDLENLVGSGKCHAALVLGVQLRPLKGGESRCRDGRRSPVATVHVRWLHRHGLPGRALQWCSTPDPYLAESRP